MATNIHSRLTNSEIHTPYFKLFNDFSEVSSDSGPYISTDLYKKAYQKDTSEEYVLTSISPVTWTKISGGVASIKRKFIGNGIVDFLSFDEAVTNTISFVAPEDMILKEVYFTPYLIGIGSGYVDYSGIIALKEVIVDSQNLVSGCVPTTQISAGRKTLTPEFNKFVASGDTIDITFEVPKLSSVNYSGQGIMGRVNVTYLDGNDDTGLTKQIYLGLDPALHSVPPSYTGVANSSGSPVSKAYSEITVNSIPLIDQKIYFYNSLNLSTTKSLTSISGPRTPGSNDFSIDGPTVNDVAAEIAASINDSTNTIDPEFIATATGNVIKIEYNRGGEIGNYCYLTTNSSALSIPSPRFSGGVSEEITLTFTAAPSDLVLNRLYTSTLVSGLFGFFETSFDITSIQIDGGSNLLSGYLGASFTANTPGSAPLSNNVTTSLVDIDFDIPISIGQVVTLKLKNHIYAPPAQVVIFAGWVATLV